MYRSLRWKFISQVFAITMLIVVANRWTAQWIVVDKITESVQTQMGDVLIKCAGPSPGGQEFEHCVAQANHGNLLKVAADFYTYCGRRQQDSQVASCAQFSQLGVKWSESEQLDSTLQLARLSFAGDVWFAVRAANDKDGPMVVYPASGSSEVMRQVWRIRDETTLYSLPLIVGALLLMSFYIFRLLMRPIRDIEHSLNAIDEKTLDSSFPIVTPYREFSKIASYLDGMRKRLAESFVKAKRFSGDVAREIKLPLSTSREDAQALASMMSPGSPEQALAVKISHEIEQMVQMSEKLLLLSKADAQMVAPTFKDICLSDSLQYWIAEARANGQALKTTVTIEPGIYWKCDPALLRLLVSNLVDNAAKYNDEDAWIEVRLTKSNDVIQFTIENPSPFISPDLQASAFERFYRADSLDGQGIAGAGLGLSLCLEIAKLHNALLEFKVTDRSTVLVTLSTFFISISGDTP